MNRLESTNPRPTTHEGRLSAAVRPASPTEDRALRDATREFEALFVSQLLQSMRRTVPESGWLGGSDGERVFRDMLDQETARMAAKADGLGIGEMLYQQLVRMPEGKQRP